MTRNSSSGPGQLRQRIGLEPAARPGVLAVGIPRIVFLLGGLMAGVFLVQLFVPDLWAYRIDNTLGFRPLRLTLGLDNGDALPALGFPLLGHIFVHGNFAHIGFNLLWLLIFGAGVARRLGVERGPWVSRAANNLVFLLFFLASGAAGALAFYIVRPQDPILMVGASGALSGLMAASMQFALRPPSPYGVEYGALAGIFSPAVMIATAAYVGINLMTAFGMMSDPGGGFGVAWEAHVGGYLFGLFAFPIFDWLAIRGRGPVTRIH